MQIIVAIASPAMGRLAERRGRRIVLLIGFCMLPLRGLVFATSTNPALVVAVQALERLGQSDAARTRAARALVRFPGSIYADGWRRRAEPPP